MSQNAPLDQKKIESLAFRVVGDKAALVAPPPGPFCRTCALLPDQFSEPVPFTRAAASNFLPGSTLQHLSPFTLVSR